MNKAAGLSLLECLIATMILSGLTVMVLSVVQQCMQQEQQWLLDLLNQSRQHRDHQYQQAIATHHAQDSTGHDAYRLSIGAHHWRRDHQFAVKPAPINQTAQQLANHARSAD